MTQARHWACLAHTLLPGEPPALVGWITYTPPALIDFPIDLLQIPQYLHVAEIFMIHHIDLAHPIGVFHGQNHWLTLPLLLPTDAAGYDGNAHSKSDQLLYHFPTSLLHGHGDGLYQRGEHKKLFRQIKRFTPAILLLFFVFSRIRLDLTTLAIAGVIGVVYFFVRIVGKYVGAYLEAIT